MRIFQVLMWALICSTMYLTRLMLRLTSLVTPVGFLPADFLGGVIILVPCSPCQRPTR